MRGGVLKYAAQATSQIDAEIGKKDHFWMETIYFVVMVKTPSQSGPGGSFLSSLQRSI